MVLRQSLEFEENEGEEFSSDRRGSHTVLIVLLFFRTLSNSNSDFKSISSSLEHENSRKPSITHRSTSLVFRKDTWKNFSRRWHCLLSGQIRTAKATRWDELLLDVLLALISSTFLSRLHSEPLLCFPMVDASHAISGNYLRSIIASEHFAARIHASSRPDGFEDASMLPARQPKPRLSRLLRRDLWQACSKTTKRAFRQQQHSLQS